MKNGLLAVCSCILGFISLLLLVEYGEPKLRPLGIAGVIIFFIILILLVLATAFSMTYFIGKQQQISLEKKKKKKSNGLKN